MTLYSYLQFFILFPHLYRILRYKLNRPITTSDRGLPRLQERSGPRIIGELVDLWNIIFIGAGLAYIWR